jgi:hypothetical protein
MPHGWSCAERSWPVIPALMLFVSVCLTGAVEARPVIIVPQEVSAAPSSAAALSIRVDSEEAIPARAILLVRGLPAKVKLSEGRVFGPGVWVVPLNGLSRLQLHTPEDTGRADLTVALVTLEGTTLAEAKFTLIIAPLAALPRQQLSGAEREAALKLVEMGDENIKTGNISAAREFYRRAANRGLSEGATAMAATYDAQELKRFGNVFGLQPDPALARKWYEKARDLGSTEAVARLQRVR